MGGEVFIDVLSSSKDEFPLPLRKEEPIVDSFVLDKHTLTGLLYLPFCRRYGRREIGPVPSQTLVPVRVRSLDIWKGRGGCVGGVDLNHTHVGMVETSILP